MSDSSRLSCLAPLMAVACGGAIGATLRYLFSAMFPTGRGDFAWATLTENVIGSLLLGFVLVLILERLRPTRLLHPFVCTGILGSFTTFSNYSVEIVSVLENGRPMAGAVYALVSVVAGLAAAVTGMIAARRIGTKKEQT